MKSFEYRHVVSFEDTNFVGNVYFSKYLSWQGRCRELFLQQYAPGMLDELNNGLAMVTLRCSCEYLDQLHPFDKVAVLMMMKHVQQNRIAMEFEYWRVAPGERMLVARGDHETACMRRDGETLRPCAIPPPLRDALKSVLGRVPGRGSAAYRPVLAPSTGAEEVRFPQDRSDAMVSTYGGHHE
ncbi:MAG: acyl-CoA thioesterase [Egibacteraceae bacterium]